MAAEVPSIKAFRDLTRRLKVLESRVRLGKQGRHSRYPKPSTANKLANLIQVSESTLPVSPSGSMVYAVCKRAIYDSANDGLFGIIPDPDDDGSTIVFPTPGMRGFFNGCRFQAVFSRSSEALGPIYVPVSGECFGFAAEITGSATVTDSKHYYNWKQIGVHPSDKYSSGDTVMGGVLPTALQLCSLAFDSNVISTSYRNTLPVGTPIKVWWAPAGDSSPAGFVFEVMSEPLMGCDF